MRLCESMYTKSMFRFCCFVRKPLKRSVNFFIKLFTLCLSCQVFNFYLFPFVYFLIFDLCKFLAAFIKYFMSACSFCFVLILAHFGLAPWLSSTWYHYFVRCFCCRDLTDISLLSTYIHLRYVDLSRNNLRDISPLSNLTHMLTLKADENKLQSAKLDVRMHYMCISSLF